MLDILCRLNDMQTICFLNLKKKSYLFGWLNSVLSAEHENAHLLALNYITFFARNVGLCHLAS